MSVIVDLQGFKTTYNKFLPKEVAFVYRNQTEVHLFKPPYPYNQLNEVEKKQVNWIERNRKVFWNEGITPYTDIRKYLDFLRDKRIFVKGGEKVIWIKELLGTECSVYNLENYDCPSLPDLEVNMKRNIDINTLCCKYHSNVCALKNVILLNKWCEINKII